jgi:glyoxylase-like metal-dependent hydrolase (beta-lactamase superfamily II)
MAAQRRQIGDITVTALSDGVLAAPLDVVLGVERTEIERLAGRKPGEPLLIAVNAFLLERAGKWALVDTGSGNSMGPTLGKLPRNLHALGVAAERIETIFLTHLHPDHSNGLVDDAGNAIYPNAEVVVHETEAAFWLDRDAASGATSRAVTISRS